MLPLEPCACASASARAASSSTRATCMPFIDENRRASAPVLAAAVMSKLPLLAYRLALLMLGGSPSDARRAALPVPGTLRIAANKVAKVGRPPAAGRRLLLFMLAGSVGSGPDEPGGAALPAPACPAAAAASHSGSCMNICEGSASIERPRMPASSASVERRRPALLKLDIATLVSDWLRLFMRDRRLGSMPTLDCAVKGGGL